VLEDVELVPERVLPVEELFVLVLALFDVWLVVGVVVPLASEPPTNNAKPPAVAAPIIAMLPITRNTLSCGFI